MVGGRLTVVSTPSAHIHGVIPFHGCLAHTLNTRWTKFTSGGEEARETLDDPRRAMLAQAS
jgi:hypothetical protein